MICYWHWALYLVKSSTREEILLLTRAGSSILGYRRNKDYDLGGILDSASCDIIYGHGGTIWHGHWVLFLEFSHGCRDTIYYHHWALYLMISLTN